MTYDEIRDLSVGDVVETHFGRAVVIDIYSTPGSRSRYVLAIYSAVDVDDLRELKLVAKSVDQKKVGHVCTFSSDCNISIPPGCKSIVIKPLP